MPPLTLLNLAPPVATLTLNRPARHNSLIPALLEEMLAALETVRARSDIRAVVLQANGRSFSTGGDLQGFVDHLDDLEDYARTIVGLLNRVILAMIDLPIPIVAAVHGIVTGGSLGLALAADVVLVAPEASFTPYYSVVGFSPDGGWTAMLPQVIGQKRAAETLMRNLTITAEQAVRWGLASRVVPGDRIQAEGRQIAGELATRHPGSLRQTKGLLTLGLGDLPALLEAERTRFVEQIMTKETQQSMIKFLKSIT